MLPCFPFRTYFFFLLYSQTNRFDHTTNIRKKQQHGKRGPRCHPSCVTRCSVCTEDDHRCSEIVNDTVSILQSPQNNPHSVIADMYKRLMQTKGVKQDKLSSIMANILLQVARNRTDAGTTGDNHTLVQHLTGRLLRWDGCRGQRPPCKRSVQPRRLVRLGVRFTTNH